MGCDRTGCMFCMYGVHLDYFTYGAMGNRFLLMKKQHPKHYNFCIEKLGMGKVLDYIGINYKYEVNGIFDKESIVEKYRFGDK